MSPSALSIVFAPTILRTNANLPAQESLLHVPKQSRYDSGSIPGVGTGARHFTQWTLQPIDTSPNSRDYSPKTLRRFTQRVDLHPIFFFVFVDNGFERNTFLEETKNYDHNGLNISMTMVLISCL